MSFSTELLADHPHLIPAVGEIRWREWGTPPEPVELSFWVDITAREAGRDALPVTWVALGSGGQAVGCVGLGEYDPPQLRDRSPWILGMVVRPTHRRFGIGRALLARVDEFAVQCGHREIWVATGGPAVPFYESCGYEITDRLPDSTILRRFVRPGSTALAPAREAADSDH